MANHATLGDAFKVSEVEAALNKQLDRAKGGMAGKLALKREIAEMKDRTEGVILGKGHLDVEGTFRALKAVGFPEDGAISLEYEENPKDPIDEIRQCVAVAKEAMSKVAGS